MDDFTIIPKEIIPLENIVYTLDEFLQSFNMFEFSNKSLLNKITTLIPIVSTPINSGGVGEVYSTIYPNIIVKNVYICIDQDRRPLIQGFCKSLNNGNLIFRTPNTILNKTNLLLPNYLSENLIGLLLYKITNRYTPSFPRILSFAVDTNAIGKNIKNVDYYGKVLTVMEKLEPFNEKIKDFKDLLYCQFQVIQALSVAQQLCKFTHNDLHLGNILTKEVPNNRPKLNIYELDNGKYLYTLFNFDTVIIDFGWSRMETKNNIITPLYEIWNEYSLQDKFNFNPYYDVFWFLWHCNHYIEETIKNAKTTSKFNKLIPPIEDQFFINLKEIIFQSFFNFKKNSIELDTLFNQELLSDYNKNVHQAIHMKRFKIEKMNSDGRRPSNATQMMSKMAIIIRDYFYKMGVEIDKDYGNLDITSNLNNLKKDLEQNKFYLSNTYIKFELQSTDGYVVQNLLWKKIHSQDKLDITFYDYQLYNENEESILYENNNVEVSYISKGINDKGSLDKIRNTIIAGTTNTLPKSMKAYKNTVFNIDLNLIFSNDKTFTDQNITIIKINQNELIKEGYRFRFDCCNIDPKNYFQNKSIIAGYLINSNFFDIYKSKTPIGYSQVNDIFFGNKVPDLFINYYGVVGINKNYKLVIDPNINNMLSYDSYFLTGPVLINNFNIEFDEKTMERKDQNGRYLFKSRKPKKHEQTQDFFNDGLKNANKIKPGELYHAANPNPRSALVIDSNYNVLFVKIEGRDDRGVGMDLSQLAQFCKTLGAKYAINLDGGRSSQLIWKASTDDFITISHTEVAYPVGSILSFIKTK